MGCDLVRHFGRILKNSSKKLRLSLLFLVLGLSCIFFLREKAQIRISSALPFGHPIQSAGLSCEQVIKLAQWGSERFGGIGQRDVFKRDRAAKVAQSFLEKLDPYRMLFTNQDLQDLKKMTEAHWDELLDSRTCSPWKNWLEENYPKAQVRVSNWVKNFKAPRGFKPQLEQPTGVGSSDNEDGYKQFASSEKELESRWQKELSEILKDNTLPVFNAYQNNITQLIWDRVEQRYFDTAPETHGLMAKAFLAALDKYSTYFSPVEFEDFYEELKGSTAGLGVRLQKVPQGFLIEKVIDDSSAQKSKVLHSGDIIEKVDDVLLSSLPFEEAKQLLKGPEKSKVSLVLNCNHTAKEGTVSEVVLERTQFDLEESKIAFQWKKIEREGSHSKKIAVVSVPTFYGRGGMGSDGEEKSVSEDFEQRIHEELLKETDHAGLVLDLRGNPGGYLEEAVTMGSFFVGNKPIVGVLEDGSTRVLKAETIAEPIYRKPLVVLVDQSSASAAEVLSGALKDYQRAVIVGSSRTYGKGTVQKLFNLEDPLLFSSSSENLGAGVLKLTTSVFYSPLGHTPANGGIVSDIKLRDKEVSQKTLPTDEISPIVDPEMKKELEIASAKHQEVVRILNEKSHERTADLKTLDSNKELAEAIEIASDLSDLQTF